MEKIKLSSYYFAACWAEIDKRDISKIPDEHANENALYYAAQSAFQNSGELSASLNYLNQFTEANMGLVWIPYRRMSSAFHEYGLVEPNWGFGDGINGSPFILRREVCRGFLSRQKRINSDFILLHKSHSSLVNSIMGKLQIGKRDYQEALEVAQYILIPNVSF